MKTIPPPCPEPESGQRYWRSLDQLAAYPLPSSRAVTEYAVPVVNGIDRSMPTWPTPPVT